MNHAGPLTIYALLSGDYKLLSNENVVGVLDGIPIGFKQLIPKASAAHFIFGDLPQRVALDDHIDGGFLRGSGFLRSNGGSTGSAEVSVRMVMRPAG